jgi:hypothetical protein
MTQAYSNPARENDPHALPDVEVWKHECNGDCDSTERNDETTCGGPGWYWWPCFPGCLPDSDPIGPFATEAEALADAQEGCDDDE